MAEKKSLKTILIAAVLLIAAVAVSVGVTVFVLSGGDETAGEAAGESQAEAALPAPLQYFAFPKGFVTSIASDGRTRHLQAFVALAYRDATAEAALVTHAPLLRSRLLSLFGRADFTALQSTEGREKLKAEALEVVNSTLAAESAVPVDRVLFTNFVLQ